MSHQQIREVPQAKPIRVVTKAAKTAAEEFAFLQNRIYPRANPADPNSSPAPTVLVPKPDLAPVGIVGSPPLFVLVNV